MTTGNLHVELGGIPPGGTTGRRLVKNGSSDYDATWKNVDEGLVTGQIIISGNFASMTGFLKCDGSFHSRASYPELAAEIGAPAVLSGMTTSFTGASLIAGEIYSAGDYLFMSGTATTTADTSTIGALYTSTDGSTWAARTAFNILNVGGNAAVATNGSIYVYTKTGGGIAYSSAFPATWQFVDDATTPDTVTEVAFGGTSSRFIAVGYSTTSSPQISYSTNGSSWTEVASGGGFNSNVASVAASPTLIIAISSTGMMKTSPDGETWTTVTITGAYGLPSRVSYVNDTFVIVLSTGHVYTTTDAVTWTHASTLPYAEGANVVWDGTFYSARPLSGGMFFTSIDLLGWNTVVDVAPTTALQGKLWMRSGTNVRWRDNNSYDAALEFPVPDISFRNGDGVIIGDFSLLRGWIKTSGQEIE